MAADAAQGWPAMSIAQADGMLSAPGQMFELEDAVIRGTTFKVYKNAPPTLRDLFAFGQLHGAKPYIVHEGERMSFAAHARAAATLANLLRDRFGVQKGDRVAIAMRNYPQYPVAFFATILAGAIATPMNSWWTGEELAYGLADSGAKLAIVDPQIYERIADEWKGLPELESIIIARETESGQRADPRVHSLEAMIGGVADWAGMDMPELPDVPLSADDDATIMYTSGTTGKPKGAVASHRAIISNIFNGLHSQSRTFLRRGEMPPAPDFENPRAALVAIPFFHATGCFALMVPSLLNAQKIVTVYKWDAGEALKLVQDEKINTVGGVPTIAWQLLEHPDRDKYDLSSIDVVSYGGAPSSPELVTQVKKTFPTAKPGNGWGMTETCAVATYSMGEDYIAHPDSAGCPPPAVQLKVVGADGRDLPAGEIGELWCKGPMNCHCYWGKPEETAKTFVDGWVVTGDLARLDSEGRVYIVDRAKDMVIRGGENVYSVEVENVLYEHPAVVDAAVIGVPHKVLGEEVAAVVHLKPGTSATEDEIRHFAAQRLAAFKVPAHVVFSPVMLPRNANGKILKTELRKMAANMAVAH